MCSYVHPTISALRYVLNFHQRVIVPFSFLNPLLQEPLRHFRSPNSQALVARSPIPNRRALIHNISISIMLNHIARSIPPVIEDLASQDMPPNTPHTLIALIRQPLVAQMLGVEVVHFEGGVVNVRGRVRGHEEAVVVDEFLAQVEMQECCDDLAWWVRVCRRGGWLHVEEVGGHEVEVLRVPG